MRNRGIGQAGPPGRSAVETAANNKDVLQDGSEPGAEDDEQKKRPKGPKKMKNIIQTTSFDASQELQTKASAISEQLEQLYPNPPIPLHHASPFQLLVAVVLSAQTTDVKVNEVTPALFARAGDAGAMSQLKALEVEDYIRTLGLAPTKAKNIVAMSKIVVDEHEGEVPDSFEGLESLPGVGHKTASVILAQVFGKLAFPVDTHIHRLAQRWGLTNGKSVEQTEADLKHLFPESKWRDVHLQMIYYGRKECPAQRHDPSECPICSWAAVPPYNREGISPSRPGKKPKRKEEA
ncbi:hypothetical protein CEUSTIGMA_g3331.t1 [Chlamydomonas eustigma]|uniref:HhH-GPD domain-containing protein n=1 Tax=Chlamydomonas eustigma TaxID=1157962 RepID=A0A250WYG2_9CHLO|nr:hypothetical protein CEUSTIGMA_g3331.t1 [Chlamydomonas eustigma]|eukprot:GAX75888.1 hypothetical protein CEUSTIGMA_g3331.t1 [Chlamydomonas eustigma]